MSSLGSSNRLSTANQVHEHTFELPELRFDQFLHPDQGGRVKYVRCAVHLIG